MKLSETSIRRPVLATVMSLVILLFGIIGLTLLPIREYPDIDPPIVSVNTFYRGAGPSVVETEITNVLEEQFATLAGVKTMESSSQEQGSVITIEFELGVDVDEAANDVRDRVSRVRGSLPREVDDPVVAKVDANAQAIVWLALSSETHGGLELSEAADLILKDRIQRLSGVGAVVIGGERRYAMRVWLDPMAMAAHGLTTQEIEAALRRENAEIPGGRVEGGGREFSIRTRGELSTAAGFSDIVVKEDAGRRVRLGAVATVEVGAENERSLARFNGQPAVGLGIVKQSKASTVDVAARIRAALPELAEALPPGMRLDVAYDSAIFIDESIDEVSKTLVIATLLVVLVVFLFLKNFRAMLVPTFAIPIAILGTFATMYFLGFTINILTLLALVLAIGMVVDDAIVMLENIYRHMEMGKSRMRAAVDGAQEVGFAVIATSVSLVAVFIPLAFLTGTIGRLFQEFGLSIASAIAISTFVALTLTPMICSRWLSPLHTGDTGWASRSFDAFFVWLGRTYERVLQAVLSHRALSLISALVVVASSAFLFQSLPRELVPTEDRGIGFGIVIAPEGATLDYTDRYLRQIENVILPLPERKGMFSAIGLAFGGPGRVTNGIFFLGLKGRDERRRTQQEIVGSLFPRMMAIPGVLAFVINPPSLGGRFSSSPVDIVLEADDYQTLSQAVQAVMAKASQLGYLVNLDTDLRLNMPQLDISIDRERASGLGVSVTDIGTTLETLLGGRVATQYKRGTKLYDVLMQMRPADRATPDIIQGLYLRSNSGLVQLANVVQVAETVGPKELNHFNRQRSARITANLVPGIGLGDALTTMEGIVQSEAPPGVRQELAGQSLEFRSSSQAVYFMFVLALIVIFLVLSAQFESFVHPLTIMLTVPLAVFGALLSLFLLKQSLNIYSQIGFIMLIGLVTKNAILIVEFANQLRNRGRGIREAVVEAASIRLRPILMTTFSTIFGVAPIALGLGAGGEARQPLGIAVVGGLLFSTMLTLVLVPVVYSLLARFTKAEPVMSLDALEQGVGAQAG